MKKLKKGGTVFFILILVLSVIGYTVFWYYTNVFSKPGRSFMRSLPQLSGIDTSRQVCFELSGDGKKTSTIDCFVPDDFDKHTSDIENIEQYKESMKSARIMNVRPIEEPKKSGFLQFYDAIQPSRSLIEKGKYLTIKKNITDRVQSLSGVTLETLQNYIYILSLEGDYKGAKEQRITLCRAFPMACKKNPISLHISGKVLTDKGLPVEDAVISLLGGTKTTTTDRDGKYSFVFESFPGQKIRIEAFKIGFSNANYGIDILSEASKQDYTKDFVLNTPVQFAIIDTIRNTISGENTGIREENFTIATPWSRYTIPFGSFVHMNGKAYKGKLTAYFFEFNKRSRNEDLLRNDIFDDVVGYAGNLMKTFGMPYVLFVADDGQRIHVLKSHPILLTNKFQEMEALRMNADKIYSSVTDDDMRFLIQKSKELGGYPINREFLIQNNMLRFPLWWVFDQRKGIWVNHPMRVISEDGTIETTFYTLSESEK